MKYLANIISIGRGILSMLLLPFINDVIIFSIIYILCGISDVLDGFIARKTNTQSKMGARIDSIADFFMFIIILVIIIRLKGEELKLFLPLIIITMFIRSINVIIGAYKFRVFVMIHTMANKITGLLVFITPILCISFNYSGLLIIVCIAAILSAIEESIIIVTSKELDLNQKSFFIK